MPETSPKPVVLVTGTNGGLGNGVVRALLADGRYAVACHYHTGRDRIDALLETSGLDPQAHTFGADLSDEAQVAAMHASFAERFGSIWGLVNMAGASSNAMSWKLSLADFRRIVDANLISTFLCTRAYAPELRERGGGRIINVASVVGETGVAGASHYCAAKAGIIGFSKATAQELAPRGVTVNALSLGYFEAGLIDHVSAEMQERLIASIPLHRFGRLDEVGGLVRYLLGEDAQYVTGQVLRINGGLAS